MSSPGASASTGPPTNTSPIKDVVSRADTASSGFLSSLGLGPENPYFSAGFGLMGVGIAATMFRMVAKHSIVLLERRMLVNCEFKVVDPSYTWFLLWLSAQEKAAASNIPRAVRWARMHSMAVQTDEDERAFNFVAGQGNHFFKYQGAWFRMRRERETRSVNLNNGNPWETIILTTLSKDRDLFPKMVQEARNYVESGTRGKLKVYTAWNTEWRQFGNPQAKRKLSSVVLAPGVSERIENDVRTFLSRKEWYRERGIPYRRGYLLHGPPGSGKTSFIRALAGELGYDVTVLHLSQRGLMDDKLTHLLANLPPRTFVIVEDVDAAFSKRIIQDTDGYQSGVTFSGFLNALDGVVSAEERVLFMTTNHLETLDPALIRPGRVDTVELIDDACPEQAYNLCMLFYGEEKVTLGHNLRDLVQEEMRRGHRFSMAELQGLFIKTDADGVVEAAKELVKQKYNT